MRGRKITFRNIGIVQGSRVWQNSETGVEIIKGKNFAEVGLYYICAPTMDGSGRTVIATRTKHDISVAVARSYAVQFRAEIAQAYIEAVGTHSSDYWERATDGMPRVPAFS